MKITATIARCMSTATHEQRRKTALEKAEEFIAHIVEPAIIEATKSGFHVTFVSRDYARYENIFFFDLVEEILKDAGYSVEPTRQHDIRIYW